MKRTLAIVAVALVAVISRGVAEGSPIDELVRDLPPQRSVGGLVKRLASLARTEEERVRAAWIWVTDNIAYDADSYFRGTSTRYDAAGVLATGKSVCSGYSDLFRELCAGLGLEVVTINGYAKGYSYYEGYRFGDTNHAWNAVRTDGEWKLYDTTWGAGHVDGADFVKRYSEFWYQTDPRLFRYWHLPSDRRWQLVDRPITLAEYEREGWVPHQSAEALSGFGFDADSILEAIRARDLVTAYEFSGGAMRIEGLPAVGTLKAGVALTVTVESPGCEKLAMINNKKWHEFARSGSTFALTFVPVAGKLSLNGRSASDKGSSYWTILEYKVK